MGELTIFFTARRTLAVARQCQGRTPSFLIFLRALCVFAVRFSAILTINTQEGDYQNFQIRKYANMQFT
jgi:hypothetical protein